MFACIHVYMYVLHVYMHLYLLFKYAHLVFFFECIKTKIFIFHLIIFSKKYQRLYLNILKYLNRKIFKISAKKTFSCMILAFFHSFIVKKSKIRTPENRIKKRNLVKAKMFGMICKLHKLNQGFRCVRYSLLIISCYYKKSKICIPPYSTLWLILFAFFNTPKSYNMNYCWLIKFLKHATLIQ